MLLRWMLEHEDTVFLNIAIVILIVAVFNLLSGSASGTRILLLVLILFIFLLEESSLGYLYGWHLLRQLDQIQVPGFEPTHTSEEDAELFLAQLPHVPGWKQPSSDQDEPLSEEVRKFNAQFEGIPSAEELNRRKSVRWASDV